MPRDSITVPFCLDDPLAAPQFGRALAAAGYNSQNISQAVPDLPHVANRLPRLAPHFPPNSPFHCLLRAFLLEAPSSESDLRLQLGDELFQLCDSLRLWRRLHDGIVAECFLTHDGEVYLASDFHSRLGDVHGHFVMGFSESSKTVSRAVARTAYGKVLDLGCGGGVQSFWLSPHAREIVGLDNNPRALQFARFGAALNGFHNLTFLESDMFSAVQGETFDLIVSNPPYVVSPTRKHEFMDGGFRGDGFCRHLIREIPHYLAENAHAHCLVDVAVPSGTLPEQRLDAWLQGLPCDAISFALTGHRPLHYALKWLSHSGFNTRHDHEAGLTDWLAYLESENIHSVDCLLVSLRRRAAADHWRHHEPPPDDKRGFYGDQIRRLFPTLDILYDPDASTLDHPWTLAPEAAITRRFTLSPNGLHESLITASLQEGLIYSLEPDPLFASLLAQCQGQASLKDLAQSAASAAGLDWHTFLRRYLKRIRQSIAAGILVLPENPPA
jgi:SAM-dependent methyltransferase